MIWLYIFALSLAPRERLLVEHSEEMDAFPITSKTKKLAYPAYTKKSIKSALTELLSDPKQLVVPHLNNKTLVEETLVMVEPSVLSDIFISAKFKLDDLHPYFTSDALKVVRLREQCPLAQFVRSFVWSIAFSAQNACSGYTTRAKALTRLI